MNEIFEVSNYIVTTVKERFQQIGYLIQLETHLIKKYVSYETFTEVAIFYGVTLIQRVLKSNKPHFILIQRLKII